MWVKLKQIDMFTMTETILADGIGYMQVDTLIYPEKENSQIYQKIHFKNDCILMVRKAEYKSMVQLLVGRKGKARIISEYGTIELDTELLQYEKTESLSCVEYKLYSGEDIVLHQKLEWTFSGIKE